MSEDEPLVLARGWIRGQVPGAVNDGERFEIHASSPEHFLFVVTSGECAGDYWFEHLDGFLAWCRLDRQTLAVTWHAEDWPDLLPPEAPEWLRTLHDWQNGPELDPAAAEFLTRMLATHPALQPVLDEHLSGWMDGEMLPHLFMADVQRWVSAHVISHPDQVTALLTWLDHEYAGTEGYVANLIAVSFVENLPDDTGVALAIRDHLGPRLRAEAARMLGGPVWSL